MPASSADKEPHFQMEIDGDPIFDYDKATLTQVRTCNTEGCDVKSKIIWYLDKERLHQYRKSLQMPRNPSLTLKQGGVWDPDIEIFGTLSPISFKGEIKNWEPHMDGWWTPEGIAEVFYPFASFMNDLEEDSWMRGDGVDEKHRKSFLVPIVKVREQIGVRKVKVTTQPRITQEQARAAFDSGDWSGEVNSWDNQENRNDLTLFFNFSNRLINWCKKMPNLK